LAIFFQGWVMQEIDSLALFSQFNKESSFNETHY